jgi:LPS O-antigen subunit length determinant protein (WzzB/FepE family)
MSSTRKSKARRSLRVKAIRSAWAIARRAGLTGPGLTQGLMDTNRDVRLAIVRAFECGYRRGKKEST